jgi:hypothetical protein
VLLQQDVSTCSKGVGGDGVREGGVCVGGFEGSSVFRGGHSRGVGGLVLWGVWCFGCLGERLVVLDVKLIDCTFAADVMLRSESDDVAKDLGLRTGQSMHPAAFDFGEGRRISRA